MERYYMHKGRHVVVATTEESEGQVQVSWVGLNPAVTGVARRGRPPKYASPVPVSELEDVDESVVTALTATPAAREADPVATSEPETLVNAEVTSTATEADSVN